MINIVDIAYIRLRAPDLALMEQFFTGIGLVVSEKRPDQLYMRSTGPLPYVHVTERGEPGHVGIAFDVVSEDELGKAAKLPGASEIEALDAPGGGKRVRVFEPNGYQIEFVHGRAMVQEIPVRRPPMNSALQPYARVNEMVRLEGGGASIRKLGHFVLCSPIVSETVSWFRENLGLIGSDEFYDDDENNIVGSFNRIDRGDDYMDHHAIYVRYHAQRGVQHIGLEAQNVDDVFAGHDHMESLQRFQHLWGPGRHREGSQIGDYWLDPYNNLYEIYTDMDRMNASGPTHRIANKDRQKGNQWGAPAPDAYIHHLGN